MIWGFHGVPRIPFDESAFFACYTLSSNREGEAPNLLTLRRHSIDRDAHPCPVHCILDLEMVLSTVYTIPLDATGHAGTAVCSRSAVAVVGNSPIDEAGEDGVEDGLTAAVGSGLDASVFDVLLTHEAELLRKVVAGNVVYVNNGDWEGHVRET